MRSLIIAGLVIANLLTAGAAFAVENNTVQATHLDRYPGIREIFHWGMSKDQIETALKNPLTDMGGNRYQAIFSAGGYDYDAVLLIAGEGLEAMVLRFNTAPDKFDALIGTLTGLYGKPSAVDAGKRATQWKDDVNDTGIIVSGEKDGLYWVTVGLRKLKTGSVSAGLEPAKISSLDGVVLGMTKKEFLKKNFFFEAQKLPPEPEMAADTEVYQASLTVNMITAVAFFEFNQDKLAYIMIYLPAEPGDKDALHKAFQDNLGFLSNIYGEPPEQGDLMVAWNDHVTEMRYGLHPMGKFVISWQLL